MRRDQYCRSMARSAVRSHPHRPAPPQPIDVLEDVAVPVLVAVGERDVPGFREMAAVLAQKEDEP
jgi:hypothetical protein